MKNITVKLQIDPKIYEAAQQFMEEKGLSIECELSEYVQKLYAKHVPNAVRRYIKKSSSPTRSLPHSPPAESTSSAAQDWH